MKDKLHPSRARAEEQQGERAPDADRKGKEIGADTTRPEQRQPEGRGVRRSHSFDQEPDGRDESAANEGTGDSDGARGTMHDDDATARQKARRRPESEWRGHEEYATDGVRDED